VCTDDVAQLQTLSPEFEHGNIFYPWNQVAGTKKLYIKFSRNAVGSCSEKGGGGWSQLSWHPHHRHTARPSDKIGDCWGKAGDCNLKCQGIN
jgi:hypothetical protein